jgi:uncharacterized damage-inducible protein DinB
MDSGITFAELLAYTEHETQHWKEWFESHPEALDRECDIAKAGTVRALLLHIFATELFFAYALLDLPKLDWENLPANTVADLFAIAEEARAKFHQFICRAMNQEWNTIKELGVGGLKASKRKMAAQAFLHSIHHRGQLATFLRQQGFDGMWIHDLIMTKVME